MDEKQRWFLAGNEWLKSISQTHIILSSINFNSRQKHARKEEITADIVELGIDLKEFYKSVEWDILGVPAQR